MVPWISFSARTCLCDLGKLELATLRLEGKRFKNSQTFSRMNLRRVRHQVGAQWMANWQENGNDIRAHSDDNHHSSSSIKCAKIPFGKCSLLDPCLLPPA